MPVFIRVLDVNDNAPTFATNYETFVCENAKANQVGVAMEINKTLRVLIRSRISLAEVFSTVTRLRRKDALLGLQK